VFPCSLKIEGNKPREFGWCIQKETVGRCLNKFQLGSEVGDWGERGADDFDQCGHKRDCPIFWASQNVQLNNNL
jgi:hypothetical protein